MGIRTQFVYETYIRATPEKVWQAITDGEFSAQYFFGLRVQSDWKVGSPIEYRQPDGTPHIKGEVLESDPPKKLSFTWRVEWHGSFEKLPPSRVTFEITELGGVVRLTLTEAHDDLKDERMLEGGKRGWPAILSGLKSLVETGEALPEFDMNYQQEGGAILMKLLEKYYPE